MGAVVIVWVMSSIVSSLVLGRAFWVFDEVVVGST
jgi:hypothetical protein